MNKAITFKKLAAVVICLSLFASCSTDDGDTALLPEGAYPLMFTATQSEPAASPQTRVSDYDDTDGSHKSKWTTGDQIKVIVSEGGNDAETTCTLGENGNITNYNPQLYWKTNQTSKINAWYSNIAGQATVTDNTVSLSDQRSALAYVLKAEETTASYNSENISLAFKHQLAKVRVNLIAEGVDLTGATVKIQGYTTCTHTNGSVSVQSGADKGYIATKAVTIDGTTYYEANLVPTSITTADNFVEITAGNKTAYGKLNSEVTLQAGNLHTFTITVKSAFSVKDETGKDVDLDKIQGTVTITGSGTQTLTVTDDATVTLKGANIRTSKESPDEASPVILVKEGKQLTLKVEGMNNSLESGNWGAILLEKDAGITIIGDGQSNSKLVVKAGASQNWDYWDFPMVGIGSTTDAACGDIKIQDVEIEVTGGETYQNGYYIGGAAIGTSSSSSTCGDIRILDSKVTVTGGPGAAAIGNGMAFGDCTNQVGDIIISGSTIKVTVKSFRYYTYWWVGAGIGTGGMNLQATVACGKIIINNFNSFDTNGWTRSGSGTGGKGIDAGYKIGRGDWDSRATCTFGGVFDGTEASNTEVTYTDQWP